MRRSIRWKILVPIIVIAVIVFAGVFWLIRQLFVDAKIHDSVEKARAILLQVEGAREYVAQQLRAGVLRMDTTDKEKILLAVPVFSAMKVGEEKSKELGVQFRVPKFYPRNPDNEPDAFEAKVLRILEKGDVPEYWAIDSATNTLRYFRPVKLTEECMMCHGDPAKSMEYWGRSDGKDITGYRMEGWKVGEVHGAFEIIVPLNPIFAEIGDIVQNFLGVFGGGLLLLVAVVLGVVMGIAKPIQRITEIVKKVAKKDYSVRPEEGLLKRQDEIGVLSNNIQVMVEQLQQAEEEAEQLRQLMDQRIQQIADYLHKVAQGHLDFAFHFEDQQLSSGAQRQLEQSFEQMVYELRHMLGTLRQVGVDLQNIAQVVTEEIKSFEHQNNEQASALNQVAVSLEQMSTAIDEVARRITHFRSLVGEVTQMVLHTQQSAQNLIASFRSIAQIVQLMEEVTTSLKEKSNEITTVVDIIEEVAEQTNLLALNAAIEAARAGEAGRGFAVVADEVRKLAERTQESTQQIRQTVASTNAEVDRVLEVVQEGAVKMEEGEQVAAKASEDMEKISAAVQDFDQIASEVAAAAEEQSATVREITHSFQSVTNAVQQGVAMMQSISAQVSKLNQITEQLAELMSHFRLGVGESSASIETGNGQPTKALTQASSQ